MQILVCFWTVLKWAFQLLKFIMQSTKNWFYNLDGNMCLSFNYHMYGRTVGTLKVLFQDLIFFHEVGNKGDQWNKAEFTLFNVSSTVVSKVRLSSLNLLWSLVIHLDYPSVPSRIFWIHFNFLEITPPISPNLEIVFRVGQETNCDIYDLNFI